MKFLDCSEIVQTFQQALELFENGVSEHHVDEWVNQITPKRISDLEALLRRSIFSVAEKAKLQNTIGLLHSIS